MHTDAAHTRTAATLVVGSFPPVAGPASASTVAAVRRAWADGDEVVTASLRAASADLVARVAGPTAGWRLERARVAAGRPPRLVLGLEAGLLGPGLSARRGVARAADLGQALIGVAGLVRALDRFDQVSVLLSGTLDLPAPLLDALWRHVDAVVVATGDEALAPGARVPSALVRTVDAYPVRPAIPGVTPVGPREVLPRDLPVVVAGIVGRLVFGRHFLEVRFQAIRVARLAKRRVVRRRG
jgi:hypothetical protein